MQKKKELRTFDWIIGVLWSVFFAVCAGIAITGVIVLFFGAIIVTIIWSPFHYVKYGPNKKNSHDMYVSGGTS